MADEEDNDEDYDEDYEARPSPVHGPLAVLTSSSKQYWGVPCGDGRAGAPGFWLPVIAPQGRALRWQSAQRTAGSPNVHEQDAESDASCRGARDLNSRSCVAATNAESTRGSSPQLRHLRRASNPAARMRYRGAGVNTYSHILWDWNGTLIDDVWLCVEIINGMRARRGLPALDAEKYRGIFDFPVQHFYERAGFDFSIEAFGSVTTEFCDEYMRRVGECCLQGGAREILKECAALGFHQSVLSATEQSQLETMVTDFGLGAIFRQVVGQSDHHSVGKLRTARELVSGLGVPCSQVVMVGDTTHDHHIAEEIGIDSVLVTVGHHDREKLQDTGAMVLDGLPQVGRLLKGNGGCAAGRTRATAEGPA